MGRLALEGYRSAGADGASVYHPAVSLRTWLTAIIGVGYDAINDRSLVVPTYASTSGKSFVTHGTQFLLPYDMEGCDGYLNKFASVHANWAC